MIVVIITEDDGNIQFIEQILRIDLETARKIEEKALGLFLVYGTERKKRLTTLKELLVIGVSNTNKCIERVCDKIKLK